MNEMITISKKELSDIKEEAVNSRLFWIHHSSEKIKQAQEQFDEEIKKLKEENKKLLDDNIKFVESNRILKIENSKMQQQQDYMYQRLRERANADRGLPNKKKNPGYVMESSKQVIDSYKDKYDITHTSVIWKTAIQTPFETGLPFDIVHDAVAEDLSALWFEYGCVLQLADNPLDISEPTGNDLFRLHFTCDRKRGYWCVDAWTTGYICPPSDRVNYREIWDTTVENDYLLENLP